MDAESANQSVYFRSKNIAHSCHASEHQLQATYRCEYRSNSCNDLYPQNTHFSSCLVFLTLCASPSPSNHSMNTFSEPPPLSFPWPILDILWYVSNPPNWMISSSTALSSCLAFKWLFEEFSCFKRLFSWAFLLIRTWKRRMRVLVAEELLELPDIGRGAPFGPDGAVMGTLRVCFRTFGILSGVYTQT